MSFTMFIYYPLELYDLNLHVSNYHVSFYVPMKCDYEL